MGGGIGVGGKFLSRGSWVQEPLRYPIICACFYVVIAHKIHCVYMIHKAHSVPLNERIYT